MMSDSSARWEQWREALNLLPHPEGGFFAETFRASDVVLHPGTTPVGLQRAASTAIYYLLPPGASSAWHRVCSDEAWHHYDGGALELLMQSPDGENARVVLGTDINAGQRPQAIVPAGWWQSARPLEREGWVLCGCTVAPGFDFADFEMATEEQRALITRRGG